MKFTMLLSVPALSLLATLGVAQQPRYKVIDLGPADNPFSMASGLNNNGLITGSETASDGTQHAVIWYGGFIGDISNPGLGGPNSSGGTVNEFGLVLGQAETAAKDPNHENFCGYGTDSQCMAFLWNYGVTTPLATLGGTNSTFGGTNNKGEAVGIAETSKRDSECPTEMALNGTGPQVLDFEAVVWGPGKNQIRQLSPLPGDTVGFACAINDMGQVVGISGRCGNTIIPGFAAGPHAVLWESDGSVQDLGSLGGTSNPTMLAVGNGALAINNRGEVAGVSALPGSTTFHPFLWTKSKGIQDLGVLPGDLVGAGLGINNRGEVVGNSISAPGPASGNPRPFLWRHGKISDLNTLVQANAPLYLLTAFGINDVGEIVGFGVTDAGDIHAYLAVPDFVVEASEGAASSAQGVTTPKVLPEKARKQLQGWYRRPK
jgi:probable HAF family extracellular repeat protein